MQALQHRPQHHHFFLLKCLNLCRGAVGLIRSSRDHLKNVDEEDALNVLTRRLNQSQHCLRIGSHFPHGADDRSFLRVDRHAASRLELTQLILEGGRVENRRPSSVIHKFSKSQVQSLQRLLCAQGLGTGTAAIYRAARSHPARTQCREVSKT